MQHSSEFGGYLFGGCLFGFFCLIFEKRYFHVFGSGQEGTKLKWLTLVKLFYVLSIPFFMSFTKVIILSSRFRHYHVNYE